VPFEEVGEWPPAVFARERLRELRADALDARGASRLARGVASVAELTDLVNDDPLREPRWALLMTALYRAGRQTEALQAFQRARKTLTVEFGLEPGPELVALERAILDHDPALEAPGIGPLELLRRARDLFEAGERAAAVAALDEGIEAARRRRSDPRSICEACIDLATYAGAQGEWPRANDAVVDAVRLARDLDDAGLLARAALVAAGNGWVSSMDPVRSPVALLREALDRLPGAPSALRARLHARLAVAESGLQPVAVALADCEEALRLAGWVDDPTARAIALHSRLVVDQDLAHLEQRQADGYELLRLADADGEPMWRAWALPALARVEALRGDVELAQAHLAELEQLAEELDDPVARYHASFGAVFRATLRSDYPGARRAIEIARDAGVSAYPDPAAAALAYFGSLGIIQLLEGTVPAAMEPMETNFPGDTMDATYRTYFAVVAVQRGDLDTARAALHRIDPGVLASLPRDAYWPSLVWLLAVACHALGDRERAEVMYGLAARFSQVVVVDLGATFLGSMSHHLGVLATTFGDIALASDHLRDAVAVHTRLGAEEWTAKSSAALERLEVSPAG
jgi:tetratricopeptide (TPR) repeat protein